MVEGSGCGSLGTHSPGTYFILRGQEAGLVVLQEEPGHPCCAASVASAVFCLAVRLPCALTPISYLGSCVWVCSEPLPSSPRVTPSALLSLLVREGFSDGLVGCPSLSLEKVCAKAQRHENRLGV